MCYIGVTDGKIEKEGIMSFSTFIFIYTILLVYLMVYTKFENTGSNRNLEKIVSEYDQEIPQSQTADNPVATRGRAAQPSRDTRKTN